MPTKEVQTECASTKLKSHSGRYRKVSDRQDRCLAATLFIRKKSVDRSFFFLIIDFAYYYMILNNYYSRPYEHTI